MPCTILVWSDLDYLRISGSSDKRLQCVCAHSGTVQSILVFLGSLTSECTVHVFMALSQDGQSILEFQNTMTRGYGYSVHVLSQDGQSIYEYSNKGHVFILVLSHDAVSEYLGNTEYSYKGCSLHVFILVYRPGMVHSILGSWDTLTRGCFCMCSSWYCLVIVRASWDLSILREWVVVWTVSLIILAVSQDSQSISIFHTLTKSGWCGLHMCSSWCYLGTVRVSWELCSGMVQHILYLKNFLWHFLASLDICLVNTILLSVAEWSSPLTTGPWPPPCSNFSFTAINHHMAVLFGGVQPEHEAVDDVYIIDFQSMVR